MLLSSENIKSFLENDGKQFKIFDLSMTNEEKQCIDNFDLKTDKIYEFLHFSTMNNLDDLENFFGEIGNNSKENVSIITNFVKNMIDMVMKGYKETNQTDYFLTIKTVHPISDYDIPRWHCDGMQKGFESRNNISKFAMVLKGPGTLFINTTPEERKTFIELEDEGKEQMEKKIATEMIVREKMDKNIKGTRLQLKNNQGAIFMAAPTRENCGIHSEPKIDKTRLFISILPGKKEEIKAMMKKYQEKDAIILRGGSDIDYKQKYLKYKSKYLQLKNR